jgi:hypothetical protein
MRNLLLSAAVVLGVGCASSNEEQRQARIHEQNSNVAAANGQYGIAGDEQRRAEDSRHRAVKKAIDEGKPIQAAPGDQVAPQP